MNTRTQTWRGLAGLTAMASLVLVSACGGGGGFEEQGSTGGEPESAEGPTELRVLIPAGSAPEIAGVKDAAAAWAQESGNEVDVRTSSDMPADLAKTFGSSDPYDLMYIDGGVFATYAEQGALYAYGDDYSAVDDIYEPLRETFSYEDELYCAPKDFSTLALVVNDEMWQEAGLTEADHPGTWEDLSAVAEQLSTDDRVGLAIEPTRDRVGAFMVQAGGWLVNEEATEATVDSEANVEALTYLKENLESGAFALTTDLDADWGGAAFGSQKAAMTVEGNWVAGAMSADYPDLEYTVLPLPEGPGGPGTLLFSQCWGIAAGSDAQVQALELVEAMTSPEQQLANAKAFGVMPALESTQEQYEREFPKSAAFVAGGEYGQGPVSLPGFPPVLDDLDSQLAGLESADPADLLAGVQDNAAAALDE